MPHHLLARPATTESNAHRLSSAFTSAFVRLTPGAAFAIRAAVGGDDAASQVFVCAADEPAAGHMLSSSVSFAASFSTTESAGLYRPRLAAAKPGAPRSASLSARRQKERTGGPVGRGVDHALRA
jgi:hypothetical protein